MIAAARGARSLSGGHGCMQMGGAWRGVHAARVVRARVCVCVVGVGCGVLPVVIGTAEQRSAVHAPGQWLLWERLKGEPCGRGRAGRGSGGRRSKQRGTQGMPLATVAAPPHPWAHP
jgi:hypothetical protein